MQRLLESIKAGEFKEDPSILDAIDLQNSYYLTMRIDGTTYTGIKYQIFNKDHKEDETQHNFLLFHNMWNVMHLKVFVTFRSCLGT